MDKKHIFVTDAASWSTIWLRLVRVKNKCDTVVLAIAYFPKL